MLAYFIRRFLYMIVTLIFVSIVGFLIINLPPGSYLQYYISQLRTQGMSVPHEMIESLERKYGLGQPLYVQYWKWVSGFIRGDFGRSFQFERDVSELIGQRLVFTAVISFASLLVTWMVALPIGIYSATHQYSVGDHVFTFLGFFGLSIPNFMLALVLMMFALKILGLPVGGLFSREYADAPWSLAKLVDLLKHIWLPLLVVAAGGTAQLIRMMRGNLLDILNMEYIQAARARGLKERLVILKHGVRNALHPLIMLLGMQLPGLISGSTVVAIVLSLPTTGPLYFNALRQQDMFLASTFLMFLAVMLVVGNFLADVALAWVDPRIRYE